jgi:hypothetical protein
MSSANKKNNEAELENVLKTSGVAFTNFKNVQSSIVEYRVFRRRDS